MVKNIIKSLIPERTRNELPYFLFKLRSPLYWGNKYHCNCCNKSFRKFLPYGIIKRENARCPYCRALERTRVLFFYLKNETPIFQGRYKILHFAPERIIETHIKKTNNFYISADINPTLADEVVDITAIKYPDAMFDFIICSHVLGHVHDEVSAINEMYRVLKPGGRAIILTVIDPHRESTYENSMIETDEERLKHYGELDLVRLHGNDFGERLERKGIIVERNDYLFHFTENERKYYCLGLGNREIIFNCKKQ